MVSENRDRMRSALQVLFPFCKGKDDGQEFPVIDIIVSLCSREGFGDIGTGVEVTRGVRLHQDCTCHKKRGIGHKRERVRDVTQTA